MTPPKWHYFIHATHGLDILNILKSGFIKKSGVIGDESLKSEEHYCRKGMYCHYIFDELPRITPSFIWNFAQNKYPIFVLDPYICKEYEMYVCNNMKYGSCKKNKEEQIMHTAGNLKRMPVLSKLRNYILNVIYRIVEAAITDKNFPADIRKDVLERSYITFHECIFSQNIPIKYIRAIMYPNQTIEVKDKNGKIIKYNFGLNKKQLSDIKKYIEEENLSIKLIEYNPKKDFHTYFDKI